MTPCLGFAPQCWLISLLIFVPRGLAPQKLEENAMLIKAVNDCQSVGRLEDCAK